MDRSLYRVHAELDETHWWFCGRREIVKTILLRHLPYAKGSMKWLDIGSGGGGMVPALQEWGSVTVCEPDAESVGNLKDRFGGSVRVVHGALDAVAGETFDAVSFFDVLEHIEDDRTALAQATRSLAAGGFLVCTVPAFPFLWSRHDTLAHHVRRYTKGELALKIEAAGFEVVRLTFFNFFLFLPIAIVRLIEKVMSRPGTDFEMGSRGVFSRMLYYIFASERYFLRFLNFPFGVSLMCIARKRQFKIN